jgi:hypothetical protein
MNEGWYTLTRDVKNPHPDRRSKGRSNQAVWERGLRVYYTPPNPAKYRAGQFHFRDNSTVSEEDAGELRFFVASAPLVLGQLVNTIGATESPESVLALAVQKGLLSLDQVKGLIAELEGMEELVHEAFRKTHWI